MSDLTTLHAEVIAHVDRADITLAQVASFAKLSRLTLERAKYLPKFLRVITVLPMVSNTFDLPSDSLGVINCWIAANQSTSKIERKDEQFVRAQISSNKYYWREGGACYLRAAPIAGTTVRLRYIQSQADPILGADTNAWITKAYDIMFWCTVMHAELYLQNTESAGLAKTMYTETLDALELADTYEEHSDQTSEAGDYL